MREIRVLCVENHSEYMWKTGDEVPQYGSEHRRLKSNVMDTDERFYTFTKAGKYPYQCSVHEKTTGRIVVQ
jgi:plastocyanin